MCNIADLKRCRCSREPTSFEPASHQRHISAAGKCNTRARESRGRTSFAGESNYARVLIIKFIFGLGSVFLLGAGAHGLWYGNFTALKSVFDYAQLPMGIVLGYYFGPANGAARASVGMFRH